MKKFLIGILSALCLVVCAFFGACGKKDKENNDDGGVVMGSYKIGYYFENDNGDFIHNPALNETGEKAIGETVTASPKPFEGYNFDEQNAQNVLSGVITAEGTLELKLYYTKVASTPDTPSATMGGYVIKSYFENELGEFIHNETIDEVGEKQVGETVTASPKTFEGYEFDEQNEQNVLSGIIRANGKLELKLYYTKAASTPDTPSANMGGYVIQSYFENELGEFVHDATQDVTGEKAVGETAGATPLALEYYNYDAQNVENVLSGVVSEDDVLVLKVYYTRWTYTITVTNGTASKTEARWGETVTLTPDDTDLVWELISGEDALLNGNELTVGKSNVVINAVTRALHTLDIRSTNYVQSTNQEVKATLTVVDGGELQGLVTLYNTEETINAHGARESYYLFATKNNQAYFYISWAGELLEIKSADITALGAGTHEYKMSIGGDGAIVCSLDGNEVLNVAVSDITSKGYGALAVAGRVGTYNEKGVLAANVTVLAGDMSLEAVKAYFSEKWSKIPVNYYIFNDVINYDVNHPQMTIDHKVEDIPLAWIYGFDGQAQALTNQIYAFNTIAEIISLADDFKAIKVQAMKQQILSSLGSFIQLYNNSLLMPLVSASQVQVPGTEVVMSADVFVRDTRWWIPNAYMLYSSWPAPHEMGVMDMLEYEVANTDDIDALYNMSTKYIADVVRALSYKGLEYYYWHEYNKDPNSVLNQWWFLYTYIGTTGENFAYAGNVFNDYTWTMDYRLSGVFFDKANQAYQTDPQAIMNNYTWMLNHQTLADVNYTVTLNALGGTVDTTTLTSATNADLTLPTPSKEGATFGGWYLNRAYEGAAMTSIPAYTNRKDITLYAKWVVDNAEQALTVDPADIFGNHMIIQRGKPFNVFGTGTDGAEVVVTLDGVTKTATVENGKWSVTFDAMDATWTAKTLSISGGETSYQFTDILVGEVWLGAGQSNMQMTLSWMNGTGVNYIGQYGYYDNFDKIRMYRQQIPNTPFGGDEANTNNWVKVNNPNEAAAQSAYSLSFALNLQKKLGVPVGVINSCMGATYIEEWLSTQSIEATGSVIDGLTLYDGQNNLIQNSRYYYGMTELLRGFQISGVIWYQGENNAFAYNYPATYPNAKNVDYAAQLKALHNQYKDVFGDDNLPLIVTELAPYAWDDYEDFRLIQRKFVSENANTYLLSTVDIGTPYDIHPVFKNELGKRAANIALEFVYEAEGVSDTLSYIPVSATKEGNTIKVQFEEGKTIQSVGALIGFKVQNAQGVLEDVTATVVNNEVVIEYAGDAVSVYYMYVKTEVGAFSTQLSYYIGQPTLYGGNGLPVGPFAVQIG